MSAQVKWVNTLEQLNVSMPKGMQDLIADTGSLSNNLRKINPNLSVQVLSQKIESASMSEQNLLSINEPTSLIRSVNLCIDATPIVHAKVVVPFITYTHFKHDIDQLGNKLFGEAFLSKHNFTRLPLQFAVIDGLITRRSVFVSAEHKILILEQFIITLNQLNNI